MSTQVWVATGLGVFFLVVLMTTALFMLFGPSRTAPPIAILIFRTTLALAGGAFGSVIPGMLDISLDAPGLAIRASVGLAFAVLIYRVNPPALMESPMQAHVNGNNATIVQNKGDSSTTNIQH